MLQTITKQEKDQVIVANYQKKRLSFFVCQNTIAKQACGSTSVFASCGVFYTKQHLT